MLYLLNNTYIKSYGNDPWDKSIYTLEDAFKTRPAVDYLVKRLIPCPSLSILFGAPGTLKSFQLADMAACIAAGKPWLNPLPGQQAQSFDTKQAGVFLLDFDNGTLRTHERIAALAKAHKLSKADPFHYSSMPTPLLDSSDSKAMGELGIRMEQREIKLLIVDNLGLVSGGGDENSIKMATIMSNWRRLAEDCNLAVILIHHQTKGSSAQSGARLGNSLRGHSSIEAAIDLSLLVERKERSPIVNLMSTKTRGADVKPFAAAFTCIHKPGTVELDEARFYGVPTSFNSKTDAVEQEILSIVSASAGINKRDLTKSVQGQLKKVGIHTISEAIERLEENGKVIMKFGSRGAKTYFQSEQSDVPEVESIPDLQLVESTA